MGKIYKYEVKQKPGTRIKAKGDTKMAAYKVQPVPGSKYGHLIVTNKPNITGDVIVRIKEEGEPMERDSYIINRKDLIPLTRDAEKRLKSKF